MSEGVIGVIVLAVVVGVEVMEAAAAAAAVVVAWTDFVALTLTDLVSECMHVVRIFHIF